MTNRTPNNTTPHPELQKSRQKLQSILQSMSTFGPSVAKPPIIDASVTINGESSYANQHQEAVHGLRALRDAVRRDLENTEKFFADPRCAALPAPSTNAPYLISVWHEVLLARQPVTGIWSTFSENGTTPPIPRKRGGRKEEGIKVDVVADGGRRWIRVNTVKNSKMLAEFRELDSYLTDSEDDDSENGRLTLRPTEFDNSVLRMARPLQAAAKANPIPGTADTPSITMQLTRLDLNPADKTVFDDRIIRTIEELKAMGIDVQLGERDDDTLLNTRRVRLTNPRRLYPTTRINLDLSILVALVSDLTHAPLPRSSEDAEARFTPSASYVEWKKARLTTQKADSLEEGPVDADHIARPSRALSTQALQESVKALWEEMKERLAPAIAGGTLEFWTTPEAVDRCMQIVGKIGGPDEKRRTRVMLASNGQLTISQQEDEFWRGSRYPCGYVPLFPVHILPAFAQSKVDHASLVTEVADSFAFFTALSKTCRVILAQDVIHDPRVLRSSASPSPTTYVSQVPLSSEDDGEIPRAAVTKANHRLTAHTVQTMLWGALRGWTTLTANKTSVKAILREMKSSGNAVWERCGQDECETASGEFQSEVAALWVVEPRSLAEGMRADFGML